MKIVHEFPPNWEFIKSQVLNLDKIKPVMCFGDTLYNPYKVTLRPDVIHHEEVHSRQQGADPESWCKRYYEDLDFRLDMEAEAYGAQVKFIRETIGSKEAGQALLHFAEALSSPLYGNLIKIQGAIELLRQHSKI